MDSRPPRQLRLPIVRPPGAAPVSPPWLPGQIRGLLFDMGNVLYDDTLWRRWVLRLLSRLGLHTNYHSFLRIWDREYMTDVHCGRREYCEAFEAFLLSLGLSRSQIDEVEAACRGQRRLLETGARSLPGVKTTLEQLHQLGFSLSAISNSEHPSSALRKQLVQFGIGEWFSTVVSSIDLRQAMPEAGCYLAVTRTVNLPPERMAFVGHDTAELAGAAAVGMPTVAFNCDADAQADVYLTRFDQLLDVIHPQPPLAAAG